MDNMNNMNRSSATTEMGDRDQSVNLIDMSLDDIIKMQKLKNARYPQNQNQNQNGVRNRKHSQQWRLGKNGPRQIKRLERNGQLRPWNRDEAWKRRTDGLPPSVIQEMAMGTLPTTSVFHRVGWNPLYTIARNRVQMALDFIKRKLPNYQRPRYQPISLPMSSTRRYHNRAYPVYNRVNFQQWVKAQQLFNARKRLYRQISGGNARPQRQAYRRNFYPRPIPRPYVPRDIAPSMPPPMPPVTPPLMPANNDFVHLESKFDEPVERAMSHYSAENDIEDEDPMRSVSPVGSIIMETCSNVSRNPFSNPSFNPFSSRTSVSRLGQGQHANPFSSGHTTGGSAEPHYSSVAYDRPVSQLSQPAAYNRPVSQLSQPAAYNRPVSQLSQPVAYNRPVSQLSQPVSQSVSQYTTYNRPMSQPVSQPMSHPVSQYTTYNRPLYPVTQCSTGYSGRLENSEPGLGRPGSHYDRSYRPTLTTGGSRYGSNLG